MPRGDGTGPMGMGPMTGRAAGYCAGYSVPGFMNPYGGRFGGGFGRGRGFGWRRWAGFPSAYQYPLPYGTGFTQDQEIELLQNHAKILKDQLENIEKRISDLESKSAKEA